MDAVTVATYTGPALVLLKLPLSVWLGTPGAIAVTLLVWMAEIATLVPVVALPVPEPPAVQ